MLLSMFMAGWIAISGVLFVNVDGAPGYGLHDVAIDAGTVTACNEDASLCKTVRIGTDGEWVLELPPATYTLQAHATHDGAQCWMPAITMDVQPSIPGGVMASLYREASWGIVMGEMLCHDNTVMLPMVAGN